MCSNINSLLQVTVFMMDDESSHSDLDLAVLQALLKGISPLSCYVCAMLSF